MTEKMKTTETIFVAITLTLLTTHAVLGQSPHTAKTSQAKAKASDAGNAEKQAQDILMRLTTIEHPENEVRVGEPDWAQRRWRAQRVTSDAMNSAAAQL